MPIIIIMTNISLYLSRPRRGTYVIRDTHDRPNFRQVKTTHDNPRSHVRHGGERASVLQVCSRHRGRVSQRELAVHDGGEKSVALPTAVDISASSRCERSRDLSTRPRLVAMPRRRRCHVKKRVTPIAWTTATTTRSRRDATGNAKEAIELAAAAAAVRADCRDFFLVPYLAIGDVDAEVNVAERA